jgi:hypothetical protein
MRDTVTERSNIASQSLTDQWRQLVLGPLLKLGNSYTCRTLWLLLVSPARSL